MIIFNMTIKGNDLLISDCNQINNNNTYSNIFYGNWL